MFHATTLYVKPYLLPEHFQNLINFLVSKGGKTKL